MKIEMLITDDTGEDSRHILFEGNNWDQLRDDLNNMKGINVKREFLKFLTAEMKKVLQYKVKTGLNGDWNEY